MDVCQRLCQATAGHKLESMVCGLILQMTNEIEGSANVEVDTGTGWETLVHAFSGVVETYKSAFATRNQKRAPPSVNM